MSVITFVLGVAIGALAENALDLSGKIVRGYRSMRDWLTYRKP